MTETIELGYALNTLYLLLSGAFVMWMAAGFSMLEAGLVRSKNTSEILAKNVGLFGIACIMYLLMGYNIMYGSSDSGVIPGFGGIVGTADFTADTVEASGHSNLADFFFQVVFVATAMSIVSGAVAERMKLWSFFAFTVVMTGLIYPIQGYWKWGEGFLHGLQFQDFAGSGVVHLCGAAAALAGVLLLGSRKGKYSADGKVRAIPGANLPLATLGTFILWLGWFGFNGGSQLAMNTLADANAVALVFVNTNAAAAAGVVGALILAKLWFGKADLTMILNGALAGLVAITAGPDSPSPLQATLFGLIAGALVVGSIVLLDKLRIDDPVGAISVHGVIGVFGLLIVPLSNDAASFGVQALGALVIFVWTFVTSFIVWAILKAVLGIRVSEEEEQAGVDWAECGLEAYPEFVK